MQHCCQWQAVTCFVCLDNILVGYTCACLASLVWRVLALCALSGVHCAMVWAFMCHSVGMLVG
jgi:hypothetical protein